MLNFLFCALMNPFQLTWGDRLQEGTFPSSILCLQKAKLIKNQVQKDEWQRLQEIFANALLMTG